jgi:hypothetical protein
MKLRQIFENLQRTGEGKSAVIGWGRGMGHQGHMYLASSVITQAKEAGADPYFVVSRTVGKDDPITPEEKLHIYKKVFPKHGHIFHTATDEMPDLTRVLQKLNEHGYSDVTVVVGADQVKALSYVKNYNGTPDKSGNIPYNFNSLNVISRQETNDPSKDLEGPRATPMRAVLQDPNASDEQKFQAWRDSMSPELSDDEVRDLMNKAHTRMSDPNFGKVEKKHKKEKVAGEGMMDLLSKTKKDVKKKAASAEEMRKYFEKEKAKEPPKHKEPGDDKNVQAVHTRHAYENSVKYANRIIREMRAREFIAEDKPGESDMPGGFVDAHQGGTDIFRDVGGYDRTYHLNRIMMATAMADGRSKKPVDMPHQSWVEKYNVAFPFTDMERMMMLQAMATIPTDGKELSKRGKSEEPKDTNKLSPTNKPKRNKYGI